MFQSQVKAVTANPGGGQPSAVALIAGKNRVNVVATALDSVVLPPWSEGLDALVFNDSNNSLAVFGRPLGAGAAGAAGDTIDGQASSVGVTIPPNSSVWFSAEGAAGDWLRMTRSYPMSKYTLNATGGATTAAAGDLTGAAYVCAAYSAVGAANLATRTAAQMIADGGLKVGDSFVLEITNTSGGTTTLTAGTGVTLTGTMTMATNSTRRFNVKVTGAAAITIQSTGVGTIS